jgi:hypothetical protein
MYLLFATNYTESEQPKLSDGSYFKLTKCKEGWFTTENFKDFVDDKKWSYTEVDKITVITTE